jgi:hypothetical protein
METVEGLRVGTVTTSHLTRSGAKPPGRQGGGADECPGHVLDVVTVNGANSNPCQRPRWRLTLIVLDPPVGNAFTPNGSVKCTWPGPALTSHQGWPPTNSAEPMIWLMASCLGALGASETQTKTTENS